MQSARVRRVQSPQKRPENEHIAREAVTQKETGRKSRMAGALQKMAMNGPGPSDLDLDSEG